MMPMRTMVPAGMRHLFCRSWSPLAVRATPPAGGTSRRVSRMHQSRYCSCESWSHSSGPRPTTLSISFTSFSLHRGLAWRRHMRDAMDAAVESCPAKRKVRTLSTICTSVILLPVLGSVPSSIVSMTSLFAVTVCDSLLRRLLTTSTHWSRRILPLARMSAKRCRKKTFQSQGGHPSMGPKPLIVLFKALMKTASWSLLKEPNDVPVAQTAIVSNAIFVTQWSMWHTPP
mmetsp:Transcript_25706/g.76705  ORF Transcript_25706/g.76705 Transcript_25706/m.76705 type:complete len:229 (+) Transcript_25706:397-1083(+)